MATRSSVSVISPNSKFMEIKFYTSINSHVANCSVIIGYDSDGKPHIVAHNLTSTSPRISVDVSLSISGVLQDSVYCMGSSSNTNVIIDYPHLLAMAHPPIPFCPALDYELIPPIPAYLGNCGVSSETAVTASLSGRSTPDLEFINDGGKTYAVPLIRTPEPVSSITEAEVPSTSADVRRVFGSNLEMDKIFKANRPSNVVELLNKFSSTQVGLSKGESKMSKNKTVLSENKLTLSTNKPTLSTNKAAPHMGKKSIPPLEQPSTSKGALQKPTNPTSGQGGLKTSLSEQNKLKNLSSSGQDRPNTLLSVSTMGRLPRYNPSTLRPVPGGFENCSGVYVPPEVEIILSYGPRFVPPTRPTFSDYVHQLMIVNNAAERQQKNPSHYLGDYLYESYDEFICPLQKPFNNVEKSILRMLAATKDFLRAHTELVIIKSDKSKSLVLIREVDYRVKMDKWISVSIEKMNYSLENDEATILRLRERFYLRYTEICKALIEYRLLCRKMGEPLPYPQSMHRGLISANKPNAPLPYLYGVIKTHKPDQPCRPICATRTWYSYWLQKIINCVIKDALAGIPAKANAGLLCRENVLDITTAADQIRGLPIIDGYVFLKFDVVDMYPNMDRATIRTVISDFLFSPYYAAHGSLPCGLVNQCVELCLSNSTLFTYNGNVYKQLRGLPQGACDSGLLATILLDYMLHTHCDSVFKRNGVKRWWKYMDDILVYMPLINVDSMCRALEAATTLSFTMDFEEPLSSSDLVHLPHALGCISFLDLLIVRCPDRVYMRTYIKPMASMRMCHYYSTCVNNWKMETIRGYITRVLLRTSNVFLRDELNRLDELFQSNMYPSCMTDSILSSILRLKLKEFEKIIRAKVPDPSHRYHSLGPLVERVKILRGYRSLLIHVSDATCVPQVKVFKSTYNPTNNPVIYGRSSRYICEDFRVTIKRVFSTIGLGQPTHRNGASLFEHLSMSLKDADPSEDAVIRSSSLCIFAVQCRECDQVFLLQGYRSKITILKEVLDDPTSALSVHCEVTGHSSTKGLIPVEFSNAAHPEITSRQQAALMRVMYLHMGYEFTSVSHMQLLSDYILRGVFRALKVLPPDYMLPVVYPSSSTM